MKELMLGGVAGLALGIALQRLGLHRRAELRCAVGLLAPEHLRCLLLAVGAGGILSALMMWLAVIDVDTIVVPPLDGGTLLGGAIFGAALGWSGLTPATAGAVLGADRFLEGLCAVAGCVAGAFLLPYAERAFPTLRSWLEADGRTWFQVTLDEPFLFAGGFLGLGCLGLFIIAAALFIRRAHETPPPPEEPAPMPVSDEPQAVQEDAFIVTLPGEEPVVVDTGEENDPQEPAPPDESSG
ncbi:MAG: hypothetical protein E7316_03685 [Clostridiales bacterium]|nr:hypothetical protein [Clostridiales bacterium]